MSGSHLAAFAGIAALLTITPGADMALVTRIALARGRPAAFRASAGVCCGLALWALLAAGGVAALMARSEPVFRAVRIAGGIYLVLLGLQALREARRRGEAPPVRRGSPFRQGLVSNLLNPKIAVFYSAVLPQFVERQGSVFLQSLALAAILIAMVVVWLAAYSSFVVRAGSVLRRPRVRAAMQRVTGAVLVGFGIRVAVD